MASIIFTTAAVAAGSAFGLSSLGTQALITAGSLAGGFLENAILGVGDRNNTTQRSSLQPPTLTQSSYGVTIPVIYGMSRVAGNITWLSDIRTVEQRNTQRVRDGKYSTRTVTTSIDRTQYIDFAYAIASVPNTESNTSDVLDSDDEGEIVFKARPALSGIRRIWADSVPLYDVRSSSSKAIPFDTFKISFYDGAESQEPDAAMESAIGIGQVPAFKGVSYIVFRDFRMNDFGGRIPNLNVEAISTLPRIMTDTAPSAIIEGNAEVYINNSQSRTITVLNKETLKKNHTIGNKNPNTGIGELGAFGYKIALDQNNQIWRPSNTDAMIEIISAKTGEIKKIDTACYPFDIAFDKVNNRMWVTFPAANNVMVFDTTNNALIQTITVAEAPHNIIITKTGESYITTFDRVVRINASNYTEINRYNTGLLPFGITENAITGDIWVAANGNDLLAIITPNTGAINYRNAGTFPISVRCHPDDSYGSVCVTTLYGNQLKTFAKDRTGLMNLGTVAFPSETLPLADGRILITQAKYDFVMLADSR